MNCHVGRIVFRTTGQRYPYRIKHLNRYAALPDHGQLRIEARFAGFDGEERFPDARHPDDSG